MSHVERNEKKITQKNIYITFQKNSKANNSKS